MINKVVITNMLIAAEAPIDNETRLNAWKFRWLVATGERPVNLYSVTFCRTCNKPIWIINARHRHLTAYCPGH